MKNISLEQAWKSMCILQDMEIQDEEEREAVSCAVFAIQRYIKDCESSERKREYNREYYRIKMQDPEYAEKKRAKDRRYQQRHKEAIREKNRKYREREREAEYAG